MNVDSCIRRGNLAMVFMLILFVSSSSTTTSASSWHQVSTEHSDELRDFDKFLGEHAAILPDLKRDPSLIADADYLAQHPELKEFLATHPGLAESFSSKFRAQQCAIPVPTIFDRVSPSVVFIHATSINPYQTADRIEHVVGSGFIFDASGLILTNSHVAFNRQSLIVTLDDGVSVPAQLVGADPIFDLAVLRITPPRGGMLSVAKLGDSDLVRVGQESLAIGNPLGLDQTLTRGTVSAINRVLPPTFFAFQEPLIQVDTPINPGNSGGPLLNPCGEVVGITTAVVPDAQSIGFAIPINLAKSVIPSLLTNGRVIRPWLGFHGQFIESALQSVLRIPLARGLLIEVIEPGGPAEQAKLQGGSLEFNIAGRDFLIGGDIVTRVNGKRLTSVDRTREALQALEVGTTVSMSVFRDGKYIEVKYRLPERPLLPGDVPGQGVAALLSGRGVKRLSTCCVPSVVRPAQPRE
jgi:serine protease Do